MKKSSLNSKVVRLATIISLAISGCAFAQSTTTPALETDFRNTFKEGEADGDPWPDDPSAPGPRTAKQGESGTAMGGFTTPLQKIIEGDEGEADTEVTTVDRPTAPGMKLGWVRMGRPMSARAATLRIGDVIARPDTDSNGIGVDPDTYQLKPLNSDSEDFYWSPHARKVFAIKSGTIEIQWQRRVPVEEGENIFIQQLVVSSAASQPTRKIFWNQQRFGFQGPQVTVPTDRVKDIYIAHTPNFPATVPEGQDDRTINVPPADPATATPAERRTLWFDQTISSGTINAYNREGRLLIEYLGNQQEGEAAGVREHLGIEIIDVLKESRPLETRVAIGEKVGPATGDPDLTPGIPITGLHGAAKPFFYEHQTGGLNQSDFYAVRRTRNAERLLPASQEGEADVRVETHSGEALIFWMEEGLRGIRWPNHQTAYILKWPEEFRTLERNPNLDELAEFYAIYARPEGSAQASATGVRLNSADNPVLQYQDDLSERQATLTAQNLFFTTVNQSDPDNRALLRYTNNGNIWFERVYSLLDSKFGGVTGEHDLLGSFDPVTGTIDPGFPITDEPKLQSLDGTQDFLKDVDYAFDENTGIITRIASGGIGADQSVRITFESVPSSALVGSRIEAPGNADDLVGHIRPESGNLYHPGAYVDPLTSGFEEASRGAIIPVNSLPKNNELEVWWFRRNRAPEEEGFTRTLWPSIVRKYRLKFPTTDPNDAIHDEIVLARNDGSRDLGIAANGNIYRQPDPNQPGYNPNEEHALMSGGVAWPLRNDLNTKELEPLGEVAQYNTSAPFVLISFTAADGRPDMKVFRVVQTNDNHDFEYEGVVGNPLQAPMPLPLLPEPIDPTTQLSRTVEVDSNQDLPAPATGVQLPFPGEREYKKFTWEDRKGTKWIYRGTHKSEESGSKSFTMRYYYKTQIGFDFPSLATPPAIGTIIPYLREDTTQSITAPDTLPIEVKFFPQWPKSAPVLHVAETLGLPKRGLPAMRGQTSVDVLYQQSLANDATRKKKSVRLFDPTIAKKFETKADIFSSITTSEFRGKTYFPLLPPHLSGRFYFDPNIGPDGALVLVGEYRDEPFGEDYFQLNMLTPDDLESLKELDSDDNSEWDEAMIKLTVSVEQYIEDPAQRGNYVSDGSPTNRSVTELTEIESQRIPVTENDDEFLYRDTATDSYALTASGGGTGFVTVVTGNGQAFTEEGEPVSLHVFKVEPPLYRGELKIVTSGNPLDEKLTLQHSGDFAGSPEDYEFAWLTAQPVDGLAPELYLFSRELYAGDDLNWEFTPDPTNDDLDSPVDLGSLANNQITINSEYGLTIKKVAASNEIPSKGKSEVFIALVGNDLSETKLLLRAFNAVGERIFPPDEVGKARGDRSAEEQELWEQVRELFEDSPAPDPAPALRRELISLVAGIGNTDFDESDTEAGRGTSKPHATLASSFIGTAPRPHELFLSLEIESLNGARVLLNGTEVVRWNIPDSEDSVEVSAPGIPSFNPLDRLFSISSEHFREGENTIFVELFTDADEGAKSNFNVRLEGLIGEETLAKWLPVQSIAKDGTVESTVKDDPGTPDDESAGIEGKLRHVIGEGGASLLTLTDNYFTMRYREKDSPNGEWSPWTRPQLAEGWIKRVLAGINPFQQRTNDLLNNPVDTDVGLITQAGPRYEGDVALNLDNINDFGLIEIYQTVLNRGRGLSIEGNPGLNVPGANDALLLATGYLNDLYMLLGLEAYGDALNPSISYSADNQQLVFGNVVTSLFAFKGQVPTLLHEELVLMRGRDDFLAPGTGINPVFNRFVWNYTRGINSGEPIYALNYNIKDVAWDYSINPFNPENRTTDGILSAADAAVAYPQGHGDAYGHFLTALKGYYDLLTNGNFTWVPRAEAVTVLGQPVSVDYFDERKFAASAAALVRTASETLDLAYRDDFTSNENAGWENLTDGKFNSRTGRTRHFGTDEWACRGGQGALFHWASANAFLPAIDPNPNHEGIQKVDRTTVPELDEIASHANAIQQSLDNADARLNPLGLSGGALTFDTSPTELDNGKTHLEQIIERATKALGNVAFAFENAQGSTNFLRRQDDLLDGQRFAILEQENAFNNELIEIYGMPYPGAIGPGRTYKQGYEGPDLIYPMVVDLPEQAMAAFNGRVDESSGNDLPPTLREQTIEIPLNTEVISFTLSGEEGPVFASFLNHPGESASYTLNAMGQIKKDATWTGQRARPGLVQTAVSNVLSSRQKLRIALDDWKAQRDDINSFLMAYRAAVNARMKAVELTGANHEEVKDLQLHIVALENTSDRLSALGEAGESFLRASARGGAPNFVFDFIAPVRGILLATGAVLKWGTLGAATKLDIVARESRNDIEEMNRELSRGLGAASWSAEHAQLIQEMQVSLNVLGGQMLSIDLAARDLDQAERDLRTVVGRGQALLSKRETFRRRAAAIIQSARNKDFAFRVFRDEALEKYRTQFDLAARYTYLAAKAYDYETGLLDSDSNSAATKFFDKIVKSRSLGVLDDNGQPQFGGSESGDPGLSSVLAEMNADWEVVEGRLGFNNPDRYRTVFSLREESARIVRDEAGDQTWKDKLQLSRLNDLLDDPDVARYALQAGDQDGLAVPGIVIPFSTSIRQGYNFFGHPLAAGDHSFSPTSFATKIRAAGIAFEGYVGMDSPTSTGGTLDDIGAVSPSDPVIATQGGLSATPYVYLIPVGTDVMRSPPLGDTSILREWNVEDVAIPLPFNIGNSDFSTRQVWTSADSLSEPAFAIRKHQAFRAVPAGTVFSSAPGFTNSRLIGRSAWNTKWKLVIPGNTLLNDADEGLQIFTESVKDIQLFLETYSYSGN